MTPTMILKHYRHQRYVVVAVLAILVVALFGLSLYLGYVNLDLVQAFRDLLSGNNSLSALVLAELRFPRAFLAPSSASASASPAPPCKVCCAIRWPSRASSACRGWRRSGR
jgi:ABC-type enterobactin transport system permease subunit